MNKKFIVGLSSLALAGTFLACGEGQITSMNQTDEAILYSIKDDQKPDSSIVKNAIEDCKNDIACKDLVSGYGSTTPVPVAVSSSANQTLPSVVSSSSATVPTFRSSSSKMQFASSDSQGALSSSSATPVPGGTGDLGTCAPVTNPITKGGSTTWKFNFNGKNSMGLSAKDIIGYDFEWNFGTYGSKASQTITGLGATDPITYLNSGVAKASVKITKGAASYDVQCSDLQVNGAAITGCKCSAAAASVDITEPAAWTVTGCTSAGANITGYTWVGATGEGASATHTFTEKNQTLAPTVNVANDDNTVQAVVCEEVKSTDATSPDYLFTEQGNDAAIAFVGNVDATLVFDLPSNWHNDNNAGTCSFVCTVQRGTAGDGKISGTIDDVKIAGGDYVTATISTAITVGKTSVPFKLDVGGNAGVTCSLAW